MHRLMQITAGLSGMVGLLTVSACVTVSRPNRGYSFERSATSGYSTSGSVSGGPSSAVSSLSSAADLGPGEAIPAGYWDDRAQSTALTGYLDKNRLPMVGARVFTNSSGNRRVILYGFVATDFGKQDAAVKTRRYMGDPALPVVNRIIVRPELLSRPQSANASPSPSPSVPSSSDSYSDTELGSVQSYQSQGQQAQDQRLFTILILLLQAMSLAL
jgi:hypothetical protein